MQRLLTLFLAMFVLVPLTPVQSSATQISDADAAATMAYELSVMEANGDFNALYDMIHPDAHAVIPRSAVIGWYQNEFAPMGVAPATITGVQFVQWTWAVTGTTYLYTAEVSFEQQRADGTWIVDVVRLVQDDYGVWRWFFGRNAEFVSEQIALYAQPVLQRAHFDSMVEFVVADLDLFWARSFSAGNESYGRPGVYAVSGYGQSGCGGLDMGVSPGYYCGMDQTIYVDLMFFEAADYAIGDFAWITIMAHEWGHHVQFLDGTWNQSSRDKELQADCLAGSYAQDAETRGLLDPGDIAEAITLTNIFGDPIGLPVDANEAHGTGDERISAFMRGYLDGFVGCGLDLTDGSGIAQPSISAQSQSTLTALLPTVSDVPSDLSLITQSERTIAEVVANYTDPAGTERLYRSWGWQGNAIARFEGNGSQSGVTAVYVSIHQLDSQAHAGEAMTFSFNDQARSTGAWEVPVDSHARETRALRTSTDVTLYAREGDYLIRLTVTSTEADPIPISVDILEEIIDKIG